MRTGLDVDDLGDLLALPILGTLATYERSGLVRLSPVWFEWQHGGFSITIPSNDVKARHLRRDPRASVVVAEAEAPMRGIEVRATARLLPSDGSTDRRIAARYMPADEIAEFLAPYGPSVLVRVEPGELRAWDFADDVGS